MQSTEKTTKNKLTPCDEGVYGILNVQEDQDQLLINFFRKIDDEEAYKMYGRIGKQ